MVVHPLCSCGTACTFLNFLRWRWIILSWIISWATISPWEHLTEIDAGLYFCQAPISRCYAPVIMVLTFKSMGAFHKYPYILLATFNETSEENDHRSCHQKPNDRTTGSVEANDTLGFQAKQILPVRFRIYTQTKITLNTSEKNQTEWMCFLGCYIGSTFQNSVQWTN